MNSKLAIVHEHDLEWESWEAAEVENRGHVYWKTLISAGTTPSDSLTVGTAIIPPGEALYSHRHRQAEIYTVLEGEGLVKIENEAQKVFPGTYVFIPGNAVHCVENTGSASLRLDYVFDADSFEEVEYVFDS